MLSADEIPLPVVSSPTDTEAHLKKTQVRSIKRLCLLGFGILLFDFIIIALLGSAIYLSSPVRKENVCLKSVTFNLTTTSLISPSPCTDFYEYACSSAKEHLASTGMSSIFSLAKDFNEKLIISALSTGRARNYSSSRAVSLLVDLYRKWEGESKTQTKTGLAGDFDFQSDHLRQVLSRVYVDAAMAATSRHYIEALRNRSTQMVAKVKASISRLLGPKDTILKETLQRVTPHVGYDSWLLNDTALDTWYVLMKGSTFAFNHSASYSENIQAWKHLKFTAKATQTDRRTDDFWESPAGEEIPWALPSLESIFLPLGYLFPGALKHASSTAATYGTLGFTTAHELLHNLLLPMTPSFLDATQCLIGQYSSIVEPKTCRSLRGKQTFSEDIADNGAIKVAFDAYRDDPRSHLTPSGDREFFLSYAREMCSAFTAEQTEKHIKTGSHSPDKYRVNVVLSNFESFSQTFSCPLGSPMNPAKKCTVW